MNGSFPNNTLRRKKILFILHFPPPTHGSAVVGKQIAESISAAAANDIYYQGNPSKSFRHTSLSFYDIHEL